MDSLVCFSEDNSPSAGLATGSLPLPLPSSSPLASRIGTVSCICLDCSPVDTSSPFSRICPASEGSVSPSECSDIVVRPLRDTLTPSLPYDNLLSFSMVFKLRLKLFRTLQNAQRAISWITYINDLNHSVPEPYDTVI